MARKKLRHWQDFRAAADHRLYSISEFYCTTFRMPVASPYYYLKIVHHILSQSFVSLRRCLSSFLDLDQMLLSSTRALFSPFFFFTILYIRWKSLTSVPSHPILCCVVGQSQTHARTHARTPKREGGGRVEQRSSRLGVDIIAQKKG